MPRTPARRCASCRTLCFGPCEVCLVRRERARGSAAARGYDAAWRRLREAHLALDPLCRFCADAGRTTPAREVDHVRPFRGLDDPRRLDPCNLRSLCSSCHARHTRASQWQGFDHHGLPHALDRAPGIFSRGQNPGGPSLG